eukprot:4175011-Pleurochrysis_carterae.AAC.1
MRAVVAATRVPSACVLAAAEDAVRRARLAAVPLVCRPMAADAGDDDAMMEVKAALLERAVTAAKANDDGLGLDVADGELL